MTGSVLKRMSITSKSLLNFLWWTGIKKAKKPESFRYRLPQPEPCISNCIIYKWTQDKCFGHKQHLKLSHNWTQNKCFGYKQHLKLWHNWTQDKHFGYKQQWDLLTCKWYHACVETSMLMWLLLRRIVPAARQTFEHVEFGTSDPPRSHTPSQRTTAPEKKKKKKFRSADLSFFIVEGHIPV